MSSSLRRGTLAAATLALAAVSLTACGAGNDAQTLRIRPDNAATHVGDIKIQNVNIVTDPHGSGEATVTARIFNEGSKDQVLKGVTSKGARAELSPARVRRSWSSRRAAPWSSAARTKPPPCWPTRRRRVSATVTRGRSPST
ncbi:hypothetical protein ACWV95_17770 [Streptomyces albus]